MRLIEHQPFDRIVIDYFNPVALLTMNFLPAYITNAHLSTRRTGLLLLLPLFLLFSSCQEATEPGENLSVPVDIAVKLTSQNGLPVANANVELTPLSGFGIYDVTQRDGQALFRDLEIPITGQLYEIEITPGRPNEGSYYDVRRIAPDQSDDVSFNGSVIRDTVLIPCSNRTILYRLYQQVPYSCGATRADTIAFDFCLEDRTADTLCTPLYRHNCPAPVTVNLPTPTMPGLTFQGMDRSGTSLGTSFTINPGDEFSYCAIFSTTVPASIRERTFAVNGGPSLSSTITLSALADSCVDCACPGDEVPLDFDLADTVCVGTEGISELELSQVLNTGDEDCVWEFEVDQPFTYSGLNLTAAPTPISGGKRGGKIRVSFTPISPGLVRDSIQLSIYRGTGGVRSICSRKLLIRFTGLSGATSCKIDTTRSTLFKAAKIDTISTCVDIPASRRLVITNTGLCDIDINAIIGASSVSGVFRVQPSSLMIKPNDTGSFTITFQPTQSSVWPNGRGSGPGRINYNALLQLSGDCGDMSLPLYGRADTNCKGSRVQIIHEWGANNDQWYEGVTINEMTNAIQYQNDNVARGAQITGSRDMWFENINVAGGSATIATDRATWRVVGNRLPSKVGETACDFSSSYIGSCGSGSMSSLNVSLWDVIVFTLPSGQCGIIWITNIADDAPVRGTPSVTVQICYPI